MNYNEIIITDHAYNKAKERLRFNDGFETIGVDTKLYRLLDVDEERIKKRSAWKKK